MPSIVPVAALTPKDCRLLGSNVVAACQRERDGPGRPTVPQSVPRKAGASRTARRLRRPVPAA